ncbi:MAG: secretin N-terminal domain-containing protein [Candidatus Nitrospinota bacterium M3_3B_026]
MRGSLITIAAFTLSACATAPKPAEKPETVTPPAIKVSEPSYGPLPPEFKMDPPPLETIEAAPSAPLSSGPKEQVVFLPGARSSETPKVSLNLRDATVEEAIDLIADVSGLKFLTRPGAGKRPLPPLLIEDASWTEALRIIVLAAGVAAASGGEDIFADTETPSAVDENDMIVVTTYENLLNEQKLRKEAADNAIKLARGRRKTAEEKYYASLLEKTERMATKSYRFRYADPGEAVAYLKKLFTNGADSANDHGVEGAKADAKKILLGPEARFAVFRAESLVTITAPEAVMPRIMQRIEEIDVRPRQVYIEARIVEIQRSHVRDLGIQWGGHAMRVTNRVFPNTIGIYGGGQGAQGPYGVSLPPEGAVDPVTGEVLPNPAGAVVGVTLGDASGAALIQARLYAMERAGVSRTLSNPKVMAINGEEAVIKSGREVPYQASSANTGVTVRFKEAVISLSVTPQIMEDNRIRLKIEAKKNEVDRELSVQGTPAIKKKELVTSVAVDNGGSAVLGGLFEGEDGGFQDRVPWFHKIPVLGWLFKNDRRVDNELELLVFITPSIIKEDRR